LLFIFLLLKNFITFVPGVPVQLPETASFTGFRGPAMAVIVSSSGQFFFSDREVSPSEMSMQMREAVRQSSEPLTLIVQADTNVTYGVLMQLNSMARNAGVKEVFHAAKPLPQ
jgi:biopolymer transport protein ExbD